MNFKIISPSKLFKIRVLLRCQLIVISHCSCLLSPALIWATHLLTAIHILAFLGLRSISTDTRLLFLLFLVLFSSSSLHLSCGSSSVLPRLALTQSPFSYPLQSTEEGRICNLEAGFSFALCLSFSLSFLTRNCLGRRPWQTFGLIDSR